MSTATSSGRRVLANGHGQGSCAVRVWLLDLADPRWDVGAALACLSPDERGRADRGVATVRRRRILQRAGLRRVAALVLGQLPEHVVIGDEGGRPVLTDGGIEVSCSAQGNVVLLAVSDGPVGVDVASVHGEDLATAQDEGWLAPAEARAIAGLPAARQPAALARCWAQKEAVLKAEGVGLARHPATAVTPVADHGAAGPWWLTAVPVPSGSVAALATQLPPPSRAVTIERLLPGGIG
jgi:4'-phosphopantetheinyl transferase